MKKVIIILANIAILAVFAGFLPSKQKTRLILTCLYTTATTYVGQNCKIFGQSTTTNPVIQTGYYYTTQNLGFTTDPCLS